MSGFSKSRIQKIVVNNAVQAQQASSATSATSAISASYALTASYAMNGGGGGGTTTGSFTGSFTGSLLGTASQALTASYLQGSITSASYALSSSYAFTSSYVLSSSYSLSSSYALNSSIASTASFYGGSVTSASYASSSTSASIAQTASYYGGDVTSASYALSSSYSERTDRINVINGSTSPAEYYPVIVDDLGNMIPYLDVDFSYTPSTNQLNVGGITGSLFGTASWATNAVTASYVLSSSGGSPGGSDTQIQFNSASAFQGLSTFTFNYISESLQQGNSVSATGQYSHAEGDLTTATGYGAHAEGSSTSATGILAHAEGEGALALGTVSHAEGSYTQAIGYASHAEGEDAQAVGDYSHAEGLSTVSTGYASHTEGEGTETLGYASHAEGYYTVASGAYQHVQGQYNLSSSAQSAFIIGNGIDGSNRRNLVFASGSQFQITGSLQVSGSITGSLSGNITGSLFGTSSWSSNSITASYVTGSIYTSTNPALSSSYASSSTTLLVTNVTDGASYALVLAGTGTTGNKQLQNTTAATIGIVPNAGRITATTVSASISSSLVTISSALSTPFTLSSTNATAGAYAGQITANSGMQGFRVNTNGQAQYLARTSTHTDRELRFQTFSDGNCYFGMQGLSGTITSDLIIRTSADAGTNNGAIRFSLMGTNKMAITSAGIKIGNQATALSAASELDVSGSFTMTGSMIYASPTSPGFNGEIVRFGSGTLVTGQLYFLSSSGTWSLANANSTGSSTGMLGLALGSSPTTNGLLIRGLAASSSYSYGTGAVVYMATSSGAMTATSPSSSNHVVRVMGYQTTIANTIYFDPDKTWVTLA